MYSVKRQLIKKFRDFCVFRGQIKDDVTSAMKFSIIIPTLNEQENIQACLQSLQPSRQQAEIIVVDGGSHDETVKFAQPLADKVLSTDRGRAKQMNDGAQQASGEVLMFLHADTFLPDNAFNLISQHLGDKYQWGRFDICLTGSHWLLPVISQMMNWRSRLTGIATGDQVIFVTRTAFEAVKGYPNIALMEDIRLSQRLNRFASPVCLTAKVNSSARRWQQFGVFKTILLMWSLRLGYFFGASPQVLAQLYRKGECWWPVKSSNYFKAKK